MLGLDTLSNITRFYVMDLMHVTLTIHLRYIRQATDSTRFKWYNFCHFNKFPFVYKPRAYDFDHNA